MGAILKEAIEKMNKEVLELRIRAHNGAIHGLSDIEIKAARDRADELEKRTSGLTVHLYKTS